MTDTAFGSTLDKLTEKDILPIIQLLTDDVMDKETMILRLVDFAFDKGIRTFVQALKKEQILHFLEGTNVPIQPEDDRRALKKHVYQAVEKLGLVGILNKQTMESLIEYTHILQFDNLNNTKEDLVDEINTEIINIGAQYILSNLSLEELQTIFKQLKIKGVGVEKDEIIDLILNPVVAEEVEEEQDLLASERDKTGEDNFITCLKPQTMENADFNKFLALNTSECIIYKLLI
jgi:hypothetical protein